MLYVARNYAAISSNVKKNCKDSKKVSKKIFKHRL